MIHYIIIIKNNYFSTLPRMRMRYSTYSGYGGWFKHTRKCDGKSLQESEWSPIRELVTPASAGIRSTSVNEPEHRTTPHHI